MRMQTFLGNRTDDRLGNSLQGRRLNSIFAFLLLLFLSRNDFQQVVVTDIVVVVITIVIVIIIGTEIDGLLPYLSSRKIDNTGC